MSLPPKRIEATVDMKNASDLELFTELAALVIDRPIDPQKSLIAQGLESLGAVELLDMLRKNGRTIEYETLLDDRIPAELVHALSEVEAPASRPVDPEARSKPFSLTSAQELWAHLESHNWEGWANISLCFSVPAACATAARLSEIAHALCRTHIATRMVLTEAAVVGQRIDPDFRLTVKVIDAPASEREALRIVERFEGETASPFVVSTRALVLASQSPEGRHYFCLSVHHAFVDRLGLHQIGRDFHKMLSNAPTSDVVAPEMDFADHALLQHSKTSSDQQRQFLQEIHGHLQQVGIAHDAPRPPIRLSDSFDLGDTPLRTQFGLSDYTRLESIAKVLSTTVPLLLQTLFSALTAELLETEEPFGSVSCQTVGNREEPLCRELVGCLDTSVPVVFHWSKDETLATLCDRTRRAFLTAYTPASRLARGAWVPRKPSEAAGVSAAHLIERLPHINIIHRASEWNDQEIRSHAIHRVQRAHWGLLLRVELPSVPSRNTGLMSDRDHAGIDIRTIGEDTQVGRVVHYALCQLLSNLLSYCDDTVGDLCLATLINENTNHMKDVAAHLAKTSASNPQSENDPFIYQKLIARQKRWYQHDDQRQLVRDNQNRFVGTAANPFPFTQLDKLQERRFLDDLNIPQPKVLHVISAEEIHDALPRLSPSLPASFVVKPVGAGHSFGVTRVQDGRDLTRHGVPFDPVHVGAELADLAKRGHAIHQGQTFLFNFSSFLIEEMVSDARGYPQPTDYKVFVCGETLLWIQLHFASKGQTWVAFTDETLSILPRPAWEPSICWRTHGALICTDQAMIEARNPDCLPEIVARSRALGRDLGLFVRLDWYADKTQGPLMGEITTFPHMLQPRGFYSAWANEQVRSVWKDPDGANAAEKPAGEPDQTGLAQATIADMIPARSKARWSVAPAITYGTLLDFIETFDLTPWDVAKGDRVGILIRDTTQFGAVLFATMNRYVAVPFAIDTPAAVLVSQLQKAGVRHLVIHSDGTFGETLKTHDQNLNIIELQTDKLVPLPFLPPKGGYVPGKPASTRALDDDVLILRTSGTTGEPKQVAFSLRRLIETGKGIAQSLELTADDIGVSMLPLHHVGGLACNLLAPVTTQGQMVFFPTFDPRSFFDALKGETGATWAYLVPAMWRQVLDYATCHPELARAKPWPHLRALRSAGERLPDKDADALAALFGPKVSILSSYGMTEAMPIAAPGLSDERHKSGSVGRILPGVDVEIIDPSDQDLLPTVSSGTVGEITVKGPAVVKPDPSGSFGKMFTPRGYFRTGDLGYVGTADPSVLFLNGRIKEVINRGGETIAPAEVETLVAQFPAFQTKEVEVMAFSRRDSILVEDTAIALTGLAEPAEIEGFWPWAKENLPKNILPKTIVMVPSLPRTLSGKFERTKFAEDLNKRIPPTELGQQDILVMDGLNTAVHPTEKENFDASRPSAPTVEDVLSVISGHSKQAVAIGPDTRLDDLGINSLAALELAAKLKIAFGCDLPNWIAIDFPTARGLHHQILQAQGQAVPPPTPTQLPSAIGAATVGPLRMLVLHGEGSDADLMRTSFAATGWISGLSDQIELIFMDAPHACAPKPEFHAAALAAGLYEKPVYRSWGVIEEESLEQSRVAVREILERERPIDAIAGICDGSLVAALIAAEHPEISLYLNISANALSRLPEGVRKADWQIRCPSVHLISRQDDVVSFPELLELSERCDKALLLQHPSGHAVPVLDTRLKEGLIGSLGHDLPATKAQMIDPPESRLLALHDQHAKQLRSVLVASPGIEDAMSFEHHLPKRAAPERICFVMLDQYHAQSCINIDALIEGRITSEQRPDRFIPIDDIPMYDRTKIDLAALSQKIPEPSQLPFMPRSPLDSQLAEIWRRVLMLNTLPGIDADFFDLGGSSLLSILLVRETEKTLGRSVSSDALLHIRTIRQFADQLDAEQRDRELTISPETGLPETGLEPEIRNGLLSHTAAWPGERAHPKSLVFGLNLETDNPPLFWCHQGAAEFQQLATHLGPDQPLYGMRSGHLLMRRTQANTESVARQYAAEIAALWPVGPILLGGNCQSARIAFEIARRLDEQGRHVALLCMLDQAVPLAYAGRVALIFGQDSNMNPAHHFRNEQIDWRRFYSGELAIDSVPGRHGQFFKRRNVEHLAQTIRSNIAAALKDEIPRTSSRKVFRDAVLTSNNRRVRITAPPVVACRGNDAMAVIDARITNDSDVPWPVVEGKKLAIGYWLHGEGLRYAIHHGIGEALSKDLAPGDSTTLRLKVEVPIAKGDYWIELGLCDNGAYWSEFIDVPIMVCQLERQRGLFERITRHLKRIIPQRG